ncbi:MAG: pyridoxal phosphate-dependent aminotransferase [Firmicutes bacterium]|nr:pyridoxal phosphate-dependent aminotransferase [Bacillota bacterium]
MAGVQLSQIRAVSEKARALAAQGKSIISLSIGEPDFDTPPHIVAAAQQALTEGQTHYGPNRGLLKLREAIAKKLAEENGIQADPETEIVVTVGAAEAIFMTMVGLLNAGDEVIVIEPAFINYVQVAQMIGAVQVIVSAREENGWGVDVADIEKALTPRTRMIIFNTPNNPTGCVYPREVLQGIADLAIKHDLLVFTDEIYEKIIYPGAQHISIASLPGMAERTITANGYSKAYAMTGWRLAYVVAQKDLMLPMLKVHQYTTTCAPTFAQYGAIAATSEPQDCVREMVAEFARRRDLVYRELSDAPGVSLVEPRGAFYAFLNVKAVGLTSMEFVNAALEEAGVAVVHGSAFGTCGEGYVRLSYANSYENISEAMARLKRFLAGRVG